MPSVSQLESKNTALAWTSASTPRGETMQDPHELINFSAGVVHGQGRPDGRLVPEAPKNRLRTMMAGAHGDPLAIEGRAHLVRAVAVEHERKDAGLLRRGADHVQSVDAKHLPGGVVEQVVLITLHVVDADPLEVIERRPEHDGIGNV